MVARARAILWCSHNRIRTNAHTVIYVDRKQSLALILDEGAECQMVGRLDGRGSIYAPAVTRNGASVQRLRRAWKKLHRWVYPAAILAFIHWISVAFDFFPGLIYFLILILLESGRIWKYVKLKAHAH